MQVHGQSSYLKIDSIVTNLTCFKVNKDKVRRATYAFPLLQLFKFFKKQSNCYKDYLVIVF